MKRPSRAEIFSLASRKLRQDFEELRMVPHAGTKGTEAERLLIGFLNAHLPMRFRATSGFIIDHDDQVSTQTDIIIYDALNCPLYRASENGAIVPNDNVAAVIEVKSSLDKSKLEDAAEKVSTAKSLVKTLSPVEKLGFNSKLVNYETIALVFAFETQLSPETLSDHYKDTILHHVLGKHIDFIFILDREMLSLSIDPTNENRWSSTLYYQVPPIEGLDIAISSVHLGENALDAFMRLLLTHLQHFRNSIDYPGFNWGTEQSGGLVRMDYLTSITNETDPQERERKLASYREHARHHIY